MADARMTVEIDVKGDASSRSWAEKAARKLEEQLSKMGLGKISTGKPAAGAAPNLLSMITPMATAASGILLLVKSSGRLQASLMGIMRAVMLLVQPIGDILGLGLRPLIYMILPIARLFRTFMAPFLSAGGKFMAESSRAFTEGKPLEGVVKFAQGLGEMLIRPIFNIGGALGAAAAELVKGAAIWAADLVKALGLGTADVVKAIIGTLIGFGGWLWNSITSSLGNIRSAIGGFGGWLWGTIVGGIGNLGGYISSFGGWLWNNMIKGIGVLAVAVGGFGSWLWGMITSGIGNITAAIGSFGSWLWNSIIRAIGNLGSWLGGLGSWLWNTITSLIRAAVKSIPVIGALIPIQKGTDYVPSTGPYLLHEGEQVIPASGARNRSIVQNISINLGGVSVASDYDVNRMVRIMDERIRDLLRTEMVR
jgi:hypothetical protein